MRGDARGRGVEGQHGQNRWVYFRCHVATMILGVLNDQFG